MAYCFLSGECHWRNHTYGDGGKSHDLKEPAGPWHFRAQEEPVGYPAAGWGQDPSATPSSEPMNVRQTIAVLLQVDREAHAGGLGQDLSEVRTGFPRAGKVHRQQPLLTGMSEPSAGFSLVLAQGVGAGNL